MSDEKQPIIVKRVKKVAGGHHGGAWKVAYADFVTAMMAFFLLLWLLNVTTDEQKNGIADYFSPNVTSKSTSGAGGVLGGQIMNESTASRSANSPSMIPVPWPPAGLNPDGENLENDPQDGGVVQKNKIQSEDKPGPQPHEANARKREEMILKETEEEIKQVIESIPELADLKNNVMMDMTQEGLRIQLTDTDQYAMFEPGSARMVTRTRKLLHAISKIVEKLPNKLALSGHTDSYTFATGPGYTNWELSSDRANASRRALLEEGLAEDRINRVSARADKDMIFKDPYDPRNRRISIILLREHMIEGFSHRERKEGTEDSTPAADPETHSGLYMPENGRVNLKQSLPNTPN